MRYLIITIMAITSTTIRAQEMATPPDTVYQMVIEPQAIPISLITTLIELYKNISGTVESSRQDPIRYNRASGRLYRKYNRWLRKEIITPEQYRALTTNLNNLLMK